MAITRLSGGNTPSDGSDPRTFPAIWNPTADLIEANETGITALQNLIGDNNLNDINDVEISAPADGEFLVYDNGNWVNGEATPPAILQVVQTVKTDGDFSTTAGSFTTVTGLTATITPSSTNSKVLILAQVSTGFGNNSSGTFRIAGGNSTTYVGDSSGSKTRGVIGQHANTTGFSSNDERILHSYSMIFLDSPATSSPITYAVEAFRNLGTVFVNRPGDELDNANTTRGASSITLMEVAG